MNNTIIIKDTEADIEAITHAQTLHGEVVDLLFKDTSKSTIGSLIVAVMLLFALKNIISANTAFVWVSAMLITYGLRLFFVAHYFKRDVPWQKSKVWLLRYNLLTCLCGFAWGSATYFILPAQANANLQSLLVLTLAGICAGSLIAYSIQSSTAIAFVGSVALVAVPTLFFNSTTLTAEIIALASFFVIFVAIASKRLARGLLSNLKMRIEAENQKKEILNLTQRQNLHMAHTPMGVIEWDTKLMITSWNNACQSIFGFSKDEVLGKHISFLIPDLAEDDVHNIEEIAVNAEDQPELKRITNKMGEAIYVEWLNTALKDDSQHVIGMATLVQDKTAFIKTQNKIHQLAYHDTLTGLPNRGLLLDRINQTTLSSKRSKSFAMIVYIDLDNFKVINDTRGHAAGDNLLVAVANRLQTAVRKQDTVARVGGDEFVIVLADIGNNNKEAYAFSQQIVLKILKAIKLPVDFEGMQHQCSASIGVCVFSGNAVAADELVQRADIAMYLAKKMGRDNCQFYDESMQPKYNHQMELKKDLSGALLNNEFEIYLQSQFDNAYQSVGAEVLLRWNHPKYGIVMPLEFIPLIEESGMIVPVGNWVLQQACLLLKKWEVSPLTSQLNLSVNVSAVQFNHPNFISDFESIILASGCNATRLCIELTESAVANSVEDIIYKMNYLSSMGVSLAIDDFGVGYSSLSVLKRLPLNELKIDKSFVQDILQGRLDGTIAQTIVQMGKNLNLRIVAEGVETQHQMEYLKDNGCKVYQGYLVSKPITIHDYEKNLTAGTQAMTSKAKKPKSTAKKSPQK